MSQSLCIHRQKQTPFAPNNPQVFGRILRQRDVCETGKEVYDPGYVVSVSYRRARPLCR
jgi:hypothetical protein